MSSSFWRHVNTVLRKADIILLVLDARSIEETRNPEIEWKVQREGKHLLYVFNKCDLVSHQEMEEAKKRLSPSVFVSSTNRLGTTILKKKLLEISKGEKMTVGVVGYPNVGKSALINALSGRSAARTSPKSGFTQGVQRVRVNDKIMLLDTPGVFPANERDEVKHGLTGAKDSAQVHDPEKIALVLITSHPHQIKQFYGIKGHDEEEILEEIGKKYRLFLKGGQVNEEAAARKLLRDWQEGRLSKTGETFK